MGGVGPSPRVEQHRVHRAAAGQRDQVKAARVSGDGQIRKGDLAWSRLAVLAQRDDQLCRLRGTRDVLRVRIQRDSGDLREQRAAVNTLSRSKIGSLS